MRSYIANGLVGHGFHIMVLFFSFPVFHGIVVSPNKRTVTVGIGSHKTVIMIESFPAGPPVKRTSFGYFIKWCMVPFTDGIIHKASLLHVLGNRFTALRRESIVPREAHSCEGMGSQSYTVMVPAGHNGSS